MAHKTTQLRMQINLTEVNEAGNLVLATGLKT